MRTVLVLGDQLNRQIGALADSDPADSRILKLKQRIEVGQL